MRKAAVSRKRRQGSSQGDVSSLTPHFFFFFSNTPHVLIVFVHEKGRDQPAAKVGDVSGLACAVVSFFQIFPMY